MKKVKVKSLKGNEILALPIVTDGGTVLIHADVELKPELINRAIRLGIKSLYIKDYPEEVINKENYNHIVISSEDDYDDVYNEGQDVSDSECADVKNEKKTEYNNKYIIKNVLEKHIYRHNSDLKIIGEQAEKIIESVIEEPEVITNITEMRNISTDMYTHCINVCALSTIMALRLKMSEKQVRNISIGAILHDIGLRYIKVPYMNTNETYMNVKDALEYKKHTIFGYSSLQDEGWIPDIAKEIILLHHERIDGKGYPFQHKGDKIKTEVKLVSLCDDFESLISGVGSPKLKIYEAIEYIKANQGIKYDATITDKLLESVAVYPVGINVITSEGEMGVVVRQNHKFTDRPVIRMLKHADGSQYKDDVEKDLMEYLTLFIVDTE